MPLGVFLRGTPSTPVGYSSTYLPAGDTSRYPEVAVEIDFTTNPTSTPRTWTDVTPYVRSAQWTRCGRQHELQRADAGTLTAVLDNRDGRFDPTNTAGAYYPGVKRMRWMRVRALWNTVEYTRWTGLIETWQQDWPSLGTDAVTVVRAVDAFKILSLHDLSGRTYVEQQTGDRAASVLSSANVPYTAQSGQTTIPADGPLSAGTKALAYLQDIVDTENGLLFADADGQIVFQDRHYRLTEASSTTTVATVGDGGGSEIPYREGQLEYDDSEVWPTVSVTPSGGTAETVSDASSQALHFDRTLERTILSNSQTEALAAAQWLSGQYADPDPRIPSLNLLPQTLTSSWPTVLGLKNSDRLTWKRGASTPIELDVFVERVSESAVPGRGWAVSLQLSPASSSTYWVLENTSLGVLDTSTILAY